MKKKFIALILAVIMTATCVGAGVLNSPDIQLVDVESGESVSTVVIPKSERSEIAVDYDGSDLAYQWQLSSDGKTWINVYGQTEESIKLSYAMVCNMLSDDGTAQVRCIVTDADNKYESNTAEVSFVEDKAVSAVDNSAAAKPAAPAVDNSAAVKAVAPAKAASLTDDDAEEPSEIYNIVINYKFGSGSKRSGESAYEQYVASVSAGLAYKVKVTLPVITGYAAYLEGETTPITEYQFNVDSVDRNISIDIYYQPATVNYTVTHHFQNIDDDKYTVDTTKTQIIQGTTEQVVPDNLAAAVDGFTSLYYERPEISAAGDTVVEIYYDRYYYLMKFDLDGGYGVEPIYARYGAPISVAAPTKHGYTFNGWDPALPATMPAKDTSYKASWTAGTSGFTVVFWYENANDNGYSFAGTYKPADVAPGTVKKSDDYKNQSFTGRDDSHFTYNAAKSQTVTVKGDGSTVLNVYFTRNTYTLKFTDGTESVLSCAKEEHEHIYTGSYKKDGFLGMGGTTYYYGGCYPDGGKDWGGATKGNTICGKEEHEHNRRCYSEQPKVVKEITAKYQADIHSNFPINDSDGKTILWNVPDGCKSFKPGTYLASINTMPGENITFTIYDQVSAATIWYYVEALNGETGTHSYNGKNFILYKSVKYTKNGVLTYAEEFHDIIGFKQWASDPKFSSFDQDGQTNTIKNNNYLYYTRKSYNLKFYNYNDYVNGKGGSVQFEAPLKDHYFVPDYPADLEPNAYVFAGWYTTAGCYDGSEADLDTMKMPASDVILYAKWELVKHDVKLWLTDKMDTLIKVDGKDVQNVTHGEFATAPDEKPENGSWDFIGWFYKDANGKEKAFDFENIPVRQDLNIYAKWGSKTPKEYTVYYKTLIDGEEVEIASPTHSSGMAGYTKTFDAKTGNALYESYREGYFPDAASKSLVIDVDVNKNVVTFWYTQKQAVPYTVKYVNEDGTELFPDKIVEDNRKVVVTENAIIKSGYLPDAMQKTLILTAEGPNVITFVYKADTQHAYYTRTHYLEDVNGEFTIERDYFEAIGDIGTTYSIEENKYTGFTYDSGHTGEVKSGKLTLDGLNLKLYYTRNSYPYTVRYLDKDTLKEVASTVKRDAVKYGKQVTEDALSIPGYTPDVSQKNLIVSVDESKNVIIFYYTENKATIKYVAVGDGVSEGVCSVSKGSETVKVVTGMPSGSAATIKDNDPTYKFVGWYSDQDCTNKVRDDATFVPTKNSGDLWTNTTYYAKFEYNLTSMTIKKEVTGGAYDANDMFIFTVKDSSGKVFAKVAVTDGQSVTVNGLTVGEEYTVTEDNNWSWRYKDQNPQKITLTADPTQNVVTVKNEIENNNWLGASSYAINQCVQTIKSAIDNFVKDLFI